MDDFIQIKLWTRKEEIASGTNPNRICRDVNYVASVTLKVMGGICIKEPFVVPEQLPEVLIEVGQRLRQEIERRRKEYCRANRD